MFDDVAATELKAFSEDLVAQLSKTSDAELRASLRSAKRAAAKKASRRRPKDLRLSVAGGARVAGGRVQPSNTVSTAKSTVDTTQAGHCCPGVSYQRKINKWRAEIQVETITVETFSNENEDLGKDKSTNVEESNASEAAASRSVERFQEHAQAEGSVQAAESAGENQSRRVRKLVEKPLMKFLGLFDSVEQAVRAYELAKEGLHGPRVNSAARSEDTKEATEQREELYADMQRLNTERPLATTGSITSISSDESSDDDSTPTRLKSRGKATGKSAESIQPKQKTSRFIGVWASNKCSKTTRWVAQIRHHKRLYLGTFSSEVEAARVYDRAALYFRGAQTPKLNFVYDEAQRQKHARVMPFCRRTGYERKQMN